MYVQKASGTNNILEKNDELEAWEPFDRNISVDFWKFAKNSRKNHNFWLEKVRI